ncbi:hypothetical protein AAZX31_20G200800 [Glycine max]|uniref:Histone deacetylation protein Rxt3 n=2 Tax=Glycine subgen. Soja TaxID=1462606 RepID=K7N4V7_SOYBN|nr:uncharacterized protein LOC100795503 isoform X2 [Glycine max]XP_028220893.1 uncharacterized protein LOC114402497 isoform X1 [Glycine soja]XP_028220894.1 uncharacterized protein LOC114402497 isoform X1 [Glycine soja]KAG5078379.1 hypothetical protein JHK82_057074 [Glycine max]KHN05020.1 hypothetical protein glysoja_013927 [Glycine soja]KRG92487.1 hypothetical protein GLYMA_20G214600v4 [Glycine max]RZB45106.1 hypothetical protein D0Y65_054792 [Glycine soja]RZB45107.1 hypothetical protein D0Y|eukprot:XP_006606405.1 uncharacterized protein LOC100795503 isoform X2 [Glycine max]
MSGAPKRSHEESVHSSSKHSNEDSGTYSKLVSLPVSNEYHMPYDISQDSRVAKVPRTEFRDADRRSPLNPVYRMSSPLNDSRADNPIGPENRIESRDSKDSRDPRFENRDTKTEKELYGEARRDPPNAKSEKDMRVEGRGDDNKDVWHDRDSHNDPKGDTKTEKDGYNVASSHLNWKDSKEYHRGKRYSDAPGGSLDTWHMLRGNTQGSVEVGKESSAAGERDYVEAHEAVSENKVDPKGDDRSKEKDRKRKDVKHREWGDREKERSDRRNSPQVSNSTGDCKESTKEDRDVERLEREKKDLPEEKENIKEREKDQMKRESWNGMEKEVSINEKEPVDASAKLPEQEPVLPEQKKQKEVDSWKNVDREAREKRKERDADLEGDRSDKHSKCLDKESNDGCADGEGMMEKEREVYNYSSQHRKRIQRSRGSPQVPNREPRFRSRAQDNDGSQGKVEVSSVVYKVGESMQELIKLWKEYESSQSQMEKNGESSNNGPTLEIRIPSEHITATNRQDALRHQYPYSANYLVRGGQLWGTDVYTYDSDLVAVLMHTGYCRPTASPPHAAIQELRATVRVLPPQDCYISTLRNNVRSRAWGAAIGCSYRVERCCIVKKGGGTIDLEPCLTHTSTIEPTLAPVTVERTMTTRAAASNALRQQRFVREVTIQYNLCNEPWIKYSISTVADKGLKKPLYTSARLKKGEVLYLETHLSRYELCFTGEKMLKVTPAAPLHDPATEKSQNHHPHSANGEKNDCENVMIDAFRWSRCKKPLPQKLMRTIGIPLPLEHIEVLEENLDWEDVQWSQAGVWIAGKEYTLARVHFLSMN